MKSDGRELSKVNQLIVAPYTGAWIEIGALTKAEFELEVAPYTGAWIEIILGGEL